MSDVARAHSLIRDIGGECWDGKSDMLERVFRAVSERYPKWTRRRIRSFWHKEAASVKFHEMMELAEVAVEAKADRYKLEKARSDHAAFIAETSALSAFFEAGDTDFYRPHLEAMGRVMGGMDSAGTRRRAGVDD